MSKFKIFNVQEDNDNTLFMVAMREKSGTQRLGNVKVRNSDDSIVSVHITFKKNEIGVVDKLNCLNKWAETMCLRNIDRKCVYVSMKKFNKEKRKSEKVYIPLNKWRVG